MINFDPIPAQNYASLYLSISHKDLFQTFGHDKQQEIVINH